MRHGEATDNVRELISDKEIYWSTLTDEGKHVVETTLSSLPSTIDKVYVSPLPRTIQTASLVRNKYPNVEYIIDNRLREINYGKYSNQKNNEELDSVREQQVAGNYFVRFGQYGENKLDIELRLSEFLISIFKSNIKFNTIMIVSHGSITSFMKRILNLKTPHLKTGKAEVFENVNFSAVIKYYKHLKKVMSDESKKRVKTIELLDLRVDLKNELVKMCKKEINNIEFDSCVFENFVDGLSTKNLIRKSQSKFDNDVILICFYNDFENFAKKWMNHYINIGVNNFVMINNKSTDASESIVSSYKDIVNIDMWEINEKYDCFKMCGWRQKLIEFYGRQKTYLFVDSDELFVFKNYEKQSINNFLSKAKCSCIKSLMLDVYSKNGIEDDNLENYKYTDLDTYRTTNNCYGERVYGGVRTRIFNIKPSLQKNSILYYTGKEILINDHFYYPWKLNKSKIQTFLLHYKFLKGDLEKYQRFALDERHWNHSREYKEYVKVLSNNTTTFFDEKYSALIVDTIKNLTR